MLQEQLITPLLLLKHRLKGVREKGNLPPKIKSIGHLHTDSTMSNK